MPRQAFTIIELLVVVTIIVVLLALLTPALDKAIYQTELTTCGARLRGLATMTLTYAYDNKRHYPHREGAMDAANWLPNYICTRDYDERPTLLSYLPSEFLLDPFTGKIDIETNRDGPVIYVNYLMWFGFRYNGATERGMYRPGDEFSWTDPISKRQRSYNVLASDEDTIRQVGVFSTHPDREGVMTFNSVQDYPGAAVFWIGQGNWLTFSWWENQATNKRGDLDLNYAYDDGSVTQFDRVKALTPDNQIGDERMDRVPEGKLPNGNEAKGEGRQVPRR